MNHILGNNCKSMIKEEKVLLGIKVSSSICISIVMYVSKRYIELKCKGVGLEDEINMTINDIGVDNGEIIKIIFFE